MKKEDLINALKIMRHILFVAKLAYEPADKMIEYLENTPLYVEYDIQEAFLSGYVANKDRDLAEITETNFQALYDIFKASAFLDRFGNKELLTPTASK